MQIVELDATGAARDLEALTDILRACVHAGASVNFVLPFEHEHARAVWRRVLGMMEAGGRRLMVARRGGRTVGTVQLDIATPPNQPHRAEVTKLLVHPDARRLGIARALMLAVEDMARREGRHLLTLDTRTGDNAEPLYRDLGFTVVGVIPGYSVAPEGGRLDATTLMYKQLISSPAPLERGGAA
jgi:ribosomal protein S18 acetylase RimI-like enzyme